MPQQATDWFSQNAPKLAAAAPAGGDWFTANAPMPPEPKKPGMLDTAWNDIKSAFSPFTKTVGDIESEVKGMDTATLREHATSMPYDSAPNMAQQSFESRRGKGLPYAIAATAAEQATPFNIRGMEESDSATEFVGHLLAGAAMAMAPSFLRRAPAVARGGLQVVRKVPAAVQSGKASVGRRMRTDTGKLKPIVSSGARTVGMLAGSSAGPIGSVTGMLAGPSVADAIIPKHPSPIVKVAKEIPYEPYRPKVQRTPASRGTEPRNPATTRAGRPPQRSTGYRTGREMVAEETKARAATRQGRVIVGPDEPPVQVAGSYWSFPEPNLRKAVLSGDRDAALVYKGRFGTLPQGASYLTDVGDAPNRGLYRSRR